MIHLFSPFIYILLVKSFFFVKPCPKSLHMIYYRKIHNIVLSILSLFMLIGITVGTYLSGKLESIDTLLCYTYDNNLIVYVSVYLFLYSKYLEWGDTLFLYLSGKPITMLHYTHHMTTAFLTYLNLENYISPSIFVFQFLNCFVHFIMYLYFAYPNGYLYKFRKIITQLQIIQHIICLSTIFYTMNMYNCEQNKYGSECALFMYSVYLFYFSNFYTKTYITKNNKYLYIFKPLSSLGLSRN